MSDELFLTELQNWYKANKSSIPDALVATKQSYKPNESNPAFQVLFTMQRLAECGKGLRFRTKDDQVGSVWSQGKEYITGILDTTSSCSSGMATSFDFDSVAEFWLDLGECDRNE